MYCPESMKTLSPVKACPLSEKDWLSASEKMKCESKNQTCCPKEDYKYHCLVNVFQNETFELCAPRIRLNYCLQYDDYGARVQINFHANCTNTSSDCGKFYDSNKAYEMPNCLKLKFEKNDGEADVKRPEISNESNFTGLYVAIPTTITLALILILLWRKTVLTNIVCDWVNCKTTRRNHLQQNGENEEMI
ncbi:uncharacterized protein LOC134277384 [Saccostrea cucullata]|uniref:uncharacterized protein LOC134277384 n=1 Tax=Saccostrea cuccullata TaxID=36930 RepID=UPI002ED1E230